MAVYDVPIVPIEKMEHPDVQPKIVPIRASSIREAINLALKSNPGWAAHRWNVMKSRDV